MESWKANRYTYRTKAMELLLKENNINYGVMSNHWNCFVKLFDKLL